MGGSASAISFDYDELPVERRFALWASSMPSYRVSAPDPLYFHCRARAWLLPPVVVTDTTLSPLRFERSAELIEAAWSDDVVLQLICYGHSAGAADGRAFVCGPGDISIQETARPCVAAGSSLRSITVKLPRAFLNEKLGAADLHGLVLRAGEAPMLSAFLSALPGALGATGPSQPRELAKLLRDHLALALRERLVPDLPVSRERAALRTRAGAHIDSHLRDPLDIGALCAALGASRSALYRAFEGENGVAFHVQRRRLARLHALLSDPSDPRPIAEIAADYRFIDRSHFTSLFRRSFGYTPGALRKRAATEPSLPEPGSDQETFNRWTNERR